jgi:hypothetical protein
MSTKRSLLRSSGALAPLMAILAAAAIAIAIALLALGFGAVALAPALLAAILIMVGALDAAGARGVLRRHDDDVEALADDAREAVPSLPGDPDVPVGATRESHTDVIPLDLPPDHPARREVARRRRLGNRFVRTHG